MYYINMYSFHSHFLDLIFSEAPSELIPAAVDEFAHSAAQGVQAGAVLEGKYRTWCSTKSAEKQADMIFCHIGLGVVNSWICQSTFLSCLAFYFLTLETFLLEHSKLVKIT